MPRPYDQQTQLGIRRLLRHAERHLIMATKATNTYVIATTFRVSVTPLRHTR